MRILLTGGSACGKSTFAEKLCTGLPEPRFYIATMRPYDDECEKKIARHRELRRFKGFTTVEQYTDMQSVKLPSGCTALLECMCNLTANEMFDGQGQICDAYDKILSGIEVLEAQCGELIVVTNEVGADVRGYDAGTVRYIETLGRLNIALAERFDCVCELVCGIPLILKGELP